MTETEQAMSDKRFLTVIALVIFLASVAIRAALQLFGGPDVGDVSWITTFAAIGASWIGITGQLRVVEKQTNGTLSKLTQEHAAKVAEETVKQILPATEYGTTLAEREAGNNG